MQDASVRKAKEVRASWCSALRKVREVPRLGLLRHLVEGVVVEDLKLVDSLFGLLPVLVEALGALGITLGRMSVLGCSSP